MPYRSDAQRRFMHAVHPQIAARWDKKYKKLKVDNKMRDLGDYDEKTGKIRVNVKMHKDDMNELASTIKHELMHKHQPNMTEEEIYKATAKTKLSNKEKEMALKVLPQGSKYVKKMHKTMVRSAAQKSFGGKY